MRKGMIYLILLLVTISLGIFYLIPASTVNLDNLYPDRALSQLQQIRQLPVQQLQAGNHNWTYLVTGKGETTLLFLHGMGGTYDIWFQQIDYFKDRYRIISVEYPPAHSLAELTAGIIAVLDKEKVQQAVVIGSSLGGYLAQYLAAHHPQRVLKVSLGNTFPPNTEIRETTRTMALLMRYLPEWLVIQQMRSRYEEEVLPASGNSPTAKAFLLSLVGGRVTKKNLLARYDCVVDYFDMPISEDIPVQIIESDNDPLIIPDLRRQLKEKYGHATTVTLHGEGHFPYLSNPENYNKILEDFIIR